MPALGGQGGHKRIALLAHHRHPDSMGHARAAEQPLPAARRVHQYLLADFLHRASTRLVRQDVNAAKNVLELQGGE